VRTPAIITVFLSFLTIPTFAQQSPRPDGKPNSIRFVVGDSDRRFDAESAKGMWLAVCFLPTIGSPESQGFIRECADKSPTVAGVRQIFVSEEPLEQFHAALAAFPGSDTLPVYRDADGQLAAQLSITRPVTAPVLVVLDPARNELFRQTGKAPPDHPSFSAFAKQFAAATQDKESREANVASHLAIEGYDPVAYLEERKAVPGDKNFESSFKGIVYRFASAANRDRFNVDPAKYLPACGGWCATAMAKGEKVEIDPKNFKVTNGRLFLFYKGLFGNAINDWNKDEPGLTVMADANWKELATEK
jgi:YHS domain-containing protein